MEQSHEYTKPLREVEDELTSLGVQPPCRFYRSPIKTDDTSYIFDNGMLPLRNGFSR
jgi:hypothetical protein